MRAGEGEQQLCPSGPISEEGSFSFHKQSPEHWSAHLPGARRLAEEQSGKEDGEEGFEDLGSRNCGVSQAFTLGCEAQHIWGSSVVRESQPAPRWLPVSTRVLCRVQMGEQCYPEERVPAGRQDMGLGRVTNSH